MPSSSKAGLLQCAHNAHRVTAIILRTGINDELIFQEPSEHTKKRL